MVRMNKNSVGPQQRVEMRVYHMVVGACAFLCCGLIAFWSQSTFLTLVDERAFEQKRDVFLWTKLVGKFRKIDEARLRSTSTHPSTSGGMCGRQRGEDRLKFS